MDTLNIKDKKTFDDSITDGINNLYGHIMDKVQKITGALYRVTDLLSDKEPLKWTLRDKALSLHNNLMSIKFIKDKDGVLDDTLNCLFQIIKSLELVSMGFFVSNLNFEILKKEYINLRNFIEGKKFDITAEKRLLSGFSPRKEKSKKERYGAGIEAPTDVQEEISGPENRKEKILEFMRTGGEKTMGEIALIFSGGISEKAVQRDLFYLVKSGKLVAKGDKRWRKYELAPLLLHAYDQDLRGNGDSGESSERPIALNSPTKAPQDANLTERNI